VTLDRSSLISTLSWATTVGLLLTIFETARAATFTPLGDLPGASFQSRAEAVSPDGSTVAGSGTTAIGSEPFIWTEAGGLQGIGRLPGVYSSSAKGVSENGAVVVGYGFDAGGMVAFRWDPQIGLQNLGDLPGGPSSSQARGTSSDGSVIVGFGTSSLGTEAFRWTAAGGLQGIGELPGGLFGSNAFAISEDGTTIVGQSSSALGTEAFRWNASGGMQPLGDLPGGSFQSSAYAVSSDGEVVVGASNVECGAFSCEEAFIWNSTEGILGLGVIPGGSRPTRANDVSSDGSIVVGTGSHGTSASAFIWSPENGIQSLKTVMRRVGVDLPGWTLKTASSVSGDGRSIVGTATNTTGQEEAFLITLPEDPELWADDPFLGAYQRTDGSFVDPILDRMGIALSYSGPDLSRGVINPGALLEGSDLRQADLQNSDLSESIFSQSDLRSADLRSANLANAILDGADLRDSSLARTNLRDADLRDSALIGADLYGANLSQVDLSGADLADADLSGVDLRSAVLQDTQFAGAFYDSATQLPIDFDPVASGMVTGTRVLNNGLSPPNPSNIIDRDWLFNLIVNNEGCDATIAYPCVTPGNPTHVTSTSWSLLELSVYETSTVSGYASQVILRDSSRFIGSVGGIDLYGNSTATVETGAENWLRAFDHSRLEVLGCWYCDLVASGSSVVFAGGHYDDLEARENAYLEFTGSTEQGGYLGVSGNAVLDMAGSVYGLAVSGNRATLHAGSEVFFSVGVAENSTLHFLGGSVAHEDSTGYGPSGVQIDGEIFAIGGHIGPGGLVVSGYASVSGGTFSAVAAPVDPFLAGPWNFSSVQSGLIEITGGDFTQTEVPESDLASLRFGARDGSRIRIFGENFSVDGSSANFGSLLLPAGTLSGTLPSGDLIENRFGHRGADCGGQLCTGRILVLAPGLDWDQDAIPNPFDNCAEEPNGDQADLDTDGTGDACFAPVDLDRDDVVDALDNCRVDANPDQADGDSDGVGDACEKNLIFWADKGLEGCATPPKRLPYEIVMSDLGNGAVIDRSAQPCDCFGVEYPVTAGTASVRFLHRTESGFVEEYCENVAPYALGLGPNQPICADGLDEDGLHELMVTPYDAPGCEAGGGNALPSSIRSFTMAPEPGLAAMIGAGVLGLIGLSRRATRRESW
jgi:uncharacterized membrane protein